MTCFYNVLKIKKLQIPAYQFTLGGMGVSWYMSSHFKHFCENVTIRKDGKKIKIVTINVDFGDPYTIVTLIYIYQFIGRSLRIFVLYKS